MPESRAHTALSPGAAQSGRVGALHTQVALGRGLARKTVRCVADTCYEEHASGSGGGT